MVVLLPVNNNFNSIVIFNIPNVFLKKVGVTTGYDSFSREGEDRIVHEIIFGVDFANAIQAGAYFFQVSAYLSNPDQVMPIHLSLHQMARAIKNSTNQMLKNDKKKKASKIGVTNADLSYHLSAESIRKLMKNATSGLDTLINLPKIKVIEVLGQQGQQLEIKK